MLSPHLGWVKPGSMVFYVWSRSQHSFSISSSDLCRDIASHIAPKATDIDKATEIAQNCMISNSYEPRITLRWVVMARIQVFFANRKANNIFDRKKSDHGLKWRGTKVKGNDMKKYLSARSLSQKTLRDGNFVDAWKSSEPPTWTWGATQQEKDNNQNRDFGSSTDAKLKTQTWLYGRQASDHRNSSEEQNFHSSGSTLASF